MLRDLFSSLPANDRKITDDFSALMDECQRESFSGLMRLELPSGELFFLVFINGEGKSVFEYKNDKWVVVQELQWLKLKGLQANVYKLEVQVQGIRTCGVILSADFQPDSSMVLSGTNVLQRVQIWCKRSEPGFIHVRAENQELIGLFLGDSVSNLEVLTINHNEAIFSVENPDDLPVKAKEEYQVRFYVGDPQHEIWLENRLRLAFAALVRMMLQRFGYMVGFTLADRLSARLTEASQAHSLDIKLSVNGMENNHLFRSLHEASEAYSYILNWFFEEASMLIGPRMSKEIAINMLEKLNPIQSELLRNNLRELRAPQFSRASVPGK